MKINNTQTSQYATMPMEDLLKKLNSSSHGLSQLAAENRLAKIGSNTIHHEKKQSQLKSFLQNFTSLMAVLLWISGFIAIFTGSIELGISI